MFRSISNHFLANIDEGSTPSQIKSIGSPIFWFSKNSHQKLFLEKMNKNWSAGLFQEIFASITSLTSLRSILFIFDQQELFFSLDSKKERITLLLFDVISQSLNFQPKKGSVKSDNCFLESIRDLSKQKKRTKYGLPLIVYLEPIMHKAFF